MIKLTLPEMNDEETSEASFEETSEASFEETSEASFEETSEASFEETSEGFLSEEEQDAMENLIEDLRDEVKQEFFAHSKGRPCDWEIKPSESGVGITARQIFTNAIFEGSTADFNKMMRS